MLHVNVTAQQFAWTFSYPEANEPHERHAHASRRTAPSLLTFTSKDVIHSFWVPEFGQKQDAVPGLHTTLHITPDRLGTFPVICTELCGLGHATMRTTAIVMTPDRVRQVGRRTSRRRSRRRTPGSAGAAVFKNNGCGACHTLTAAGTAGKVGPDLDKLTTYAKQAKQPLADFVRTSIVDPNAYVQPAIRRT